MKGKVFAVIAVVILVIMGFFLYRSYSFISNADTYESLDEFMCLGKRSIVSEGQQGTYDTSIDTDPLCMIPDTYTCDGVRVMKRSSRFSDTALPLPCHCIDKDGKRNIGLNLGDGRCYRNPSES